MTPPSGRAATSPRRPVPAPERPRHLEVVRGRPAPGRRPPKAFVALAALVTASALFGLVAANVVLGQAGFVQAELTQRVESMRIDVEQLELEVATLRSPSRIAARAIELGLVPATATTVLAPHDDAARSRAGR